MSQIIEQVLALDKFIIVEIFTQTKSEPRKPFSPAFRVHFKKRTFFLT